MFIMYVDESGDSGIVNSPTSHFVLSGLIIHELKWKLFLDEIITLRKSLRINFGLKLREEFHASALINSPGNLKRIKRNDRLSMLRFYAKKLSEFDYISVINVVINKEDKSQ